MQHAPNTQLPPKLYDIIHGATVTVDWTDGRLHRLTALRLVSYPGYYKVGFCYGLLYDCTPVRVVLPFTILTKRRWKTDLVYYAKKSNVNAKNLGFFDNVTFSYGGREDVQNAPGNAGNRAYGLPTLPTSTTAG